MLKFRLRQVSLYKAITMKMINVLFSATPQDVLGLEFLAMALYGIELCHLQAPVVLLLETDTFVHKKGGFMGPKSGHYKEEEIPIHWSHIQSPKPYPLSYLQSLYTVLFI